MRLQNDISASAVCHSKRFNFDRGCIGSHISLFPALVACHVALDSTLLLRGYSQ